MALPAEPPDVQIFHSPAEAAAGEARGLRLGGFGRLLWLELKRLARGWRWRGLLILAALGAFWWRREGFGVGRAAFFPLGERGLIGFSALFGVAAIALGSDSLSQVARARAQRLFDTRPLGDFRLALARSIAAFALMEVAMAATLGEILFLRFLMNLPCAAPPLWAALLFWWTPLTLLGVALGVAARAWLRNDAAGLSAAGVILAFFTVAGWRVLSPVSFFLEFAPEIGLALPVRALALDGLRALLLSLALLALGAVGQRRWTPRSPWRPEPPYTRRPFPVLRRLFFPLRQWRMADPFSRFAALALIPLALWMARPWVAEWRYLNDRRARWNHQAPPLPPDLAAQTLPAWKIAALEMDVEARPGAPARFAISAENLSTSTLTYGAFALSPAWGAPETRRENGEISARPLRSAPVPGVWILPFDPPLGPGEKRRIEFMAPSRRGARRHFEWAWHSRFADWGRLGAWWPRACGFDMINHRILIPARPAQLRMRLAAPRDRTPVLPGAEARWNEQEGGRWEIESRVPLNRAALILAPYSAAERDFNGLRVKFLVFPDHLDLAEFLLDLYEPRFQRLRRALGAPPLAFEFHETAAAPPEADSLALPSEELDALAKFLVDYRKRKQDDLYRQFNQFFPRLQLAALSTWADASLGGADEPYLLRVTLVRYLHETALGYGLEPDSSWLRNRPRAVTAFDPWRLPRRDAPRPFDFREADMQRLRLPWDDSAALAETESDLWTRRALAFHHLLRYLVGEEAYPKLVSEIFAWPGERAFTQRDLLALAQNHTSAPLEAITRQWLGSAQPPAFEALEARVFLDREPGTRALLYTTEVKITNSGKGTWPVTATLFLDQDQVDRQVTLPSGETLDLTFQTRTRPQVFSLDAQAWIPQIPVFTSDKTKRDRRVLFLKSITDRTGGVLD